MTTCATKSLFENLDQKVYIRDGTLMKVINVGQIKFGGIDSNNSEWSCNALYIPVGYTRIRYWRVDIGKTVQKVSNFVPI